MTETVKAGRHDVEITHPEKLLFPDDGITKKDLVDYYERVAPTMLPYMEGRPISMQRFPDGIDKPGFFEKKLPDYYPGWISRASIEVKDDGRTQEQVVCDNAATLVYLANHDCITPHTWLSRADRLDHPDQMIFDLDPAAGDFNSVILAAKELRKAVEDDGLTPYVMTTGSRGLHVLVPLDRSADFDTARAYARGLSARLAKERPDRFTVEMSKEKRDDRLFLDYTRNSYGQTSVTPYAVRAKRGAPVATPLEWHELDAGVTSQSFNVRNLFKRLSKKVDPWKGIMDDARPLPARPAKRAT
jgi:bifunctional non-homologous end joining protein LigD